MANETKTYSEHQVQVLLDKIADKDGEIAKLKKKLANVKYELDDARSSRKLMKDWVERLKDDFLNLVDEAEKLGWMEDFINERQRA